MRGLFIFLPPFALRYVVFCLPNIFSQHSEQTVRPVILDFNYYPPLNNCSPWFNPLCDFINLKN